MSAPIMKCGHTANSHYKDKAGKWKPCCVICYGICEGATEIAEEQPDLTGRKARCYCGKVVDSNTNLAFFQYRPDEEYDEYYCGCDGWE